MTKGKWRPIIRYDTEHNVAHYHRYHHKKKEHDRSFPVPGGNDTKNYKFIFEKAQKEIEENWKKMKDEFFRS